MSFSHQPFGFGAKVPSASVGFGGQPFGSATGFSSAFSVPAPTQVPSPTQIPAPVQTSASNSTSGSVPVPTQSTMPWGQIYAPQSLLHNDAIEQMLSCLQESKNIQTAMLQEIKQLQMKQSSEHEYKNTHYGIYCDACKKGNIQGVRYKCLFCKDYDICEECEAKQNVHDPLHVFVKIRESMSFTAVIEKKPLLFDRIE
jgi:hypothetical protein